MSCNKCAGPTKVRRKKAIGAYSYCDRCGPMYTPPYSEARLALAGGETLDGDDEDDEDDGPQT
jgi:hypothetical protein